MTINLKNELLGFTGTEQWFRHSLFRQYSYTEGVQYLASNGGAYWLIDLIIFLQHEHSVIKEQAFQTWDLKVKDDQTATLICSDGDNNTIHSHQLNYTDFPLEEIRFFLIDKILLLPSEY